MASDAAPDYKKTVFLPKTPFPMKAGLAKREPEILARWAEMDLHNRLRAESKDKEKFVLHDGPPYANGHLHIGHALNKILKDMIVRCRQMLGQNSIYVPGWDCHGLPIEWKIEEGYRAKGKDKDTVPVLEFRKECRTFAEEWIGIQAEEFQRLGVMGHWESRYATMDYASEAQIVRELGKFLMNGGLYKGSKPVLWSVVEKTALADAEVEYHDHTSTTIWIRFPVEEPSMPELEDASIVIWTTTPWTMPGNRAIAYGNDIDYMLVEITEVAEGGLARIGERLVVACDLLEQVCKDAKITGHEEIKRMRGGDLAGTVCHHPWFGMGYDYDVPLFPGDFVTTEQGTGFVHIAPGHGEDDYKLGLANGLEIPDTVNGDGVYFDHVPLVAGMHVFKVAPTVLERMMDADALLAHGKLTHSYPHSWRSKAPLIFRNTPQWFISMETNDLREKALKAIEDTRWVPAQGQARIQSMIETRPDWCVSRQRVWGVPIPIYVSKKTGEPLRDPKVIERIAQAFEAEGADAWFDGDPCRFLGNDYVADEWEAVTDIVEVWFDSGSTHAFVLEAREDLKWPADLYLEGSDQHRGWFHSSLLESCGTRGRAPYDAVLTHGFVLDEQGRKMSKSLGNVTVPQKVVDTSGADILRLWVVASDYSGDLRIGPDILKQTTDTYRRLRNTLRFLLGALSNFDAETETVPVGEMPELERWVLNRLHGLDADVRRCCNDYEFHGLFSDLHHFCAVELSAFYFDIRKDALYCDHPDDPTRKACRTVLDQIFNCLVSWLAPFICFTAEEAWLTRHGDTDAEGKPRSIHLETFPATPDSWSDPALAERWAHIRRVRRVVTGALEKERAAKTIGASLQATVTIHVSAELLAACEGVDLSELCITSGTTVMDMATTAAPEDAFTLPDETDVAVQVVRAEGEKCLRCWKVLPDVGDPGHQHAGVCGRCDAVLRRLPVAL